LFQDTIGKTRKVGHWGPDAELGCDSQPGVSAPNEFRKCCCRNFGQESPECYDKQHGEVYKHSAAGERLAGKSGDTGRMVRTPAYAWFEGFDYKPDTDIMEDSRYLDYYDRTITLLWHDEDLN